MAREARLVAFLWHQRSAPLDTRERLLAVLPHATAGGVLLETCHRVELYVAVAGSTASREWIADRAGLAEIDRASMSVAEDADAAAHLFRVASGLDSVVAGEPQILRQVRRAYTGSARPHPALARLFERALHVGRTVRRDAGLATERSVGSLAVDEIVRALPDAASATVVVVGAGEMGKLAVRALAHRVGRVIVANRDTAHGAAVAEAYGASSISLADLPRILFQADALISAADTRGEILTAELLRARLGSGPLLLLDVAVPRSVGREARGLRGLDYRTVDDLPGAAASAPVAAIAAGSARCAAEAERFVRESAVDRVEIIVALRARAEDLRRQKLDRALRRLSHLAPRDRRIVEALTTTLVDALLYPPTVALREDRAGPEAALALFETPRGGRR
jgi:glutamyl-tRNA reductase